MSTEPQAAAPEQLPEPEPEGQHLYIDELVPAGVPNAADRQQIKDRSRKQADKIALRRETLRMILQHRNGREFLAWVMLELGCLHSPLEARSFDEAVVHFFAGRRQVALDLQQEALQADRKNYMLMLEENL